MSNYNLYITLSQQEKLLLQSEAKKRDMSLTGFVKSLLPLKESDVAPPALYIPTDRIDYKIGSRKKCVKAYFTDTEMKAIEYMAGKEPLSRFVARRALQGENVLDIKIEDDDYYFVYSVIEPIYTSIYMYLHNLKGIKEIDSVTIENFICELEKSNTFLVNLTEYFKNNRRSLRKTRLRELRKLSNFLIKDYELYTVEDQ